MVATTFAELKDKQDPLVMSALDWVVLLHPWAAGCSYIPADLTDSGGVLQALPAGWKTSGEIQKKAGVNLTPDTKTTDIEGYGSSGPRRTIVTGEGYEVDYFAQEAMRKINQELYYNIDLSAVNAVAGKGFRASKTSDLSIRYYSMIALAYDGMPTAELYPFWVYGKVAVSKRGPLAGQQGEEMGFPLTMKVFEDSDWGKVFDFGVAGSGFNAPIATNAGFLAAPTSISVTPAAVTLPIGDVTQLVVTDNNGFDRTAECTFGTSNAARATVNATGRVTAVATGSAATITATFDALTDTSAVTVS